MTADELQEIEEYLAGGMDRDPKPLAIARLKLAGEKLAAEVREHRKLFADFAEEAKLCRNANRGIMPSYIEKRLPPL